MCLPQNPLLRHVPRQPIPPQRHVPPQNPLLRHVTRQPTPLQRHVPPAGRATATCTQPTDTAPATCASGRTGYCDMCPPSRILFSDMCPRRIGYCDMYPASRSRLSDMYPPQDPLLRHVPGQPALPQRHVTAAGPATATCARPAGSSSATCAPGESATATCTPPADPASATCTPRRTRYCDMYPANRPCLSDMYHSQDGLLRHVTRQKIPPQRHVPPAGRATATCTRPTYPATETYDARRIGYCDMCPASRHRSSDMFLPRGALPHGEGTRAKTGGMANHVNIPTERTFVIHISLMIMGESPHDAIRGEARWSGRIRPAT